MATLKSDRLRVSNRCIPACWAFRLKRVQELHNSIGCYVARDQQTMVIRIMIGIAGVSIIQRRRRTHPLFLRSLVSKHLTRKVSTFVEKYFDWILHLFYVMLLPSSNNFNGGQAYCAVRQNVAMSLPKEISFRTYNGQGSYAVVSCDKLIGKR